MLYAEEVANFFRKLIDENDSTFIDDADVTSFLELGYAEFRQFVSDIDPQFYVATHTATVSGKEYDLNNVLLGTTPTGTRLSQIIRVVTLSGTEVKNILNPVYSYESLVSPSGYAARYMLQARKLHFAGTLNEDIRIEYIPLSLVDWTQITAGDNEFVDDLLQFHDLIALFACRSYFQTDGATNPATERQIANRKQQLIDFVERGRLRGANRFVADEDPYCGY